MDDKLKDLQKVLDLTDEEFADFLRENPQQGVIDVEAEDITPKKESQDNPHTGTSLDSFLEEENIEIDNTKLSQRERWKKRDEQRTNEELAKKAEKKLKKRREALKRAANKYRKKRKKIRNEPLSNLAIKNYDSEVEHKEITDVDKPGLPLKITPDLEKLLFPYFIAGASIRAIHQQFGQKYNFGLQTLYTARDLYKWDQRRVAILRVSRNTSDLEMAERFKDYGAFFDDLLSEAMIRFQNNSQTGQNTNPFNTLKVTNVKDMKDLMEMLQNLQNGGVKKSELTLKGGVKMSDKKASKLLEILAEDEEEEK